MPFGLVSTQLQVSPEDYLLGLADLTGELMRYAVNAVGLGYPDAAFRALQTLRPLQAGTCALVSDPRWTVACAHGRSGEPNMGHRTIRLPRVQRAPGVWAAQ